MEGGGLIFQPTSKGGTIGGGGNSRGGVLEVLRYVHLFSPVTHLFGLGGECGWVSFKSGARPSAETTTSREIENAIFRHGY